MSVGLYVLDTSEQIASLRSKIKAVIDLIYGKARKSDLDRVSVLVRETSDESLLEDLEGVGGYCPSADFIQLSIDPSNRKFVRNPSGALARSFAHEPHHAARIHAGINVTHRTFLEYIVSEGLVDQFVYEITGRLPVWNKPLSPPEMDRLFKMVEKNGKTSMTDKDYEEWFLTGSREKNIPRWAGYSLGLYAVRRYLKSHPKESAIKLTAMPAGNILSA